MGLRIMKNNKRLRETIFQFCYAMYTNIVHMARNLKKFFGKCLAPFMWPAENRQKHGYQYVNIINK